MTSSLAFEKALEDLDKALTHLEKAVMAHKARTDNALLADEAQHLKQHAIQALSLVSTTLRTLKEQQSHATH